MSAMEDSKLIETKSISILLPILQQIYPDILELADRKDPRGDLSYRVKVKTGYDYRYVECKAERKDTGNLFLETWSSEESFTPGWMVATKSHELYYHFLDTKRVVVIPNLERLRRWAFFGTLSIQGQMYMYPEKPISSIAKNKQGYCSWGRCVPYKVFYGHGLAYEATEDTLLEKLMEANLEKDNQSNA